MNQDTYDDHGGGDQYDEQQIDGEEHKYDQDNNYYDGGEEYDPNFPFWVKAIYDYECVNDTEISFKENDIVCITADYNDGWWCGDLNGNVGRVPANYFEYLDQEDNSGYYPNTSNNETYNEDGGYIDGGDTYNYDQQQQEDYGGDDQYNNHHNDGYDQNQQDYDDGQQDDQQDYGSAPTGTLSKEEEAKREKLRLKREQFKKEMKDLQDKLKSQTASRDKMGEEIEKLEKVKGDMEEQVRVLKMLKFLTLVAVKTENDIELDTEISMHARQTGIALTQDLRALRTVLSSVKSSTIIDQPRKVFDSKIEEIEKKLTANLNNLDVCDNLKKVVVTDLSAFQNEFDQLLIKDIAADMPLPPPQQHQHAPALGGQLVPPTFNLPPPPGQAIGSNPAPAGGSVVYLTDKEKRKTMKDVKKLEEKEKKELKKLEKQELKKKDDEVVWKPSKINK